MKRSPLKSDPEKQRAWQERTRRKQIEAQCNGSQRRKRINPVNRKRKAKLYAKQFGEKSEWLREVYPACPVTGVQPGSYFPIDHAHVLGTRGAGADSSGICPLWRPVHIDFDSSMTDERFAEKWPKSREWIRNRARVLEAIYQEEVACAGS